jgi:hypothetical protein
MKDILYDDDYDDDLEKSRHARDDNTKYGREMGLD